MSSKNEDPVRMATPAGKTGKSRDLRNRRSSTNGSIAKSDPLPVREGGRRLGEGPSWLTGGTRTLIRRFAAPSPGGRRNNFAIVVPGWKGRWIQLRPLFI